MNEQLWEPQFHHYRESLLLTCSLHIHHLSFSKTNPNSLAYYTFAFFRNINCTTSFTPWHAARAVAAAVSRRWRSLMPPKPSRPRTAPKPNAQSLRPPLSWFRRTRPTPAAEYLRKLRRHPAARINHHPAVMRPACFVSHSEPARMMTRTASLVARKRHSRRVSISVFCEAPPVMMLTGTRFRRRRHGEDSAP